MLFTHRARYSMEVNEHIQAQRLPADSVVFVDRCKTNCIFAFGEP